MWFISDVLMLRSDSEGPLQMSWSLWWEQPAGGKKQEEKLAVREQTMTPDPCYFRFYSFTKARKMWCDTMSSGHGEVNKEIHLGPGRYALIDVKIHFDKNLTAELTIKLKFDVKHEVYGIWNCKPKGLRL